METARLIFLHLMFFAATGLAVLVVQFAVPLCVCGVRRITTLIQPSDQSQVTSSTVGGRPAFYACARPFSDGFSFSNIPAAAGPTALPPDNDTPT